MTACSALKSASQGSATASPEILALTDDQAVFVICDRSLRLILVTDGLFFGTLLLPA